VATASRRLGLRCEEPALNAPFPPNSRFCSRPQLHCGKFTFRIAPDLRGSLWRHTYPRGFEPSSRADSAMSSVVKSSISERLSSLEFLLQFSSMRRGQSPSLVFCFSHPLTSPAITAGFPELHCVLRDVPRLVPADRVELLFLSLTDGQVRTELETDGSTDYRRLLRLGSRAHQRHAPGGQRGWGA